MKHRLLSSFICLLVCLGAAAEAVSEWQARQTAIAFRSGRTGARATVQSPTLVYTGGMAVNSGTRSVAGEATCYVYNFGTDGGFVIVSGEDCLMPVLAFAERGTFAVGEEMPDGVRGWLRSIDELVETCRRSGVASLIIDGMEINTDLEDLEIDVQPLLQSRWNQDAPYNNLCPLLATSVSERSATGCAATAAAQIMYYHRWPDCGTGTHTNNTNNVTVDFSASHYDWSLMRDTYAEGSYAEEEGLAVARLMHDVGMAANMAYDVESGTQNIYIYRALFRHFKYSSSLRYIQRGSLTTGEWLSTIRAELEAGRPVYYSGFAEDYSMGHAFVCDGITESDYFLHFNWGWSGNSDGFYFVNLLNPANPGIGGGVGRFNIEQVAIVGIQPASADESGAEKLPVLNLHKFYRPAVYSATLGKNFRTTVNGLYNEGPEAATFQLAPALYKDGQFVQLVGTPQNRTLATFGGLTNLTVNVNLPEDTPEGDYQLRLVVSLDGTAWQEVTYYYETYQRYIDLTVSGTAVTLYAKQQSGVGMQIVPLDPVPSVAVPGVAYPTKALFSTSGSYAFNGNVGYALYALPRLSDNDGVSYFEEEMDTVLIASGKESVFMYDVAVHTLASTITLPESGEYLLQYYFTDPLSGNDIVLSEHTITVPAPVVHYPRCVLMEQLYESATTDGFSQLEQWSTTYGEAFISVVFSVTESKVGYVGGYADSLGVAALGTASFLNRRSFASPAACGEAVAQMVTSPAVASLDMDARFAQETGGSAVEVTLYSTFAYPMAEGSDCRFALLTLEREWYEGSSEFSFIDVARGFWPADAFNGVPVSASAVIGAGDKVSATLTAHIGNIADLKDVLLVGLLIHGRTGEVLQAVELPYSEIAPAVGEAVPTAVVWTDEDGTALMNVGITTGIGAGVMPRIAPQELVWTSSNPSVASVDESTGLITTLAPGVTEIRAASAALPALAATLTLTVQQPDYTRTQQFETGKLHYILSGSGEQLVLEGALNGTDIRHMRKYLFAPVETGDEISPVAVPISLRQHIDLSACSIVAGGEPYLDRLVTADDVIGERMFSDCPVLETLQLPSTVKSIGDNAFMGSGRLTHMEIPAKVESIGYAPFLLCSDLQELTVASDNTAYRSIDGVLYNYSGNTLLAYPANKSGTAFTAESTVSSVAPFAFAHQRHLRDYSAQIRLNSIGYGAFYACPSLATVSLMKRQSSVADYTFGQCVALEKIVCEALTPPECTALAFSGVDAGACRLFVPEESISDYRTAPGWSLFSRWADVSESVEAVLPDGGKAEVCAVGNRLLSVRSSQDGQSVAIYSPSGMRVAQVVTLGQGAEVLVRLPSAGPYIVQFPGCSLKVWVK